MESVIFKLRVIYTFTTSSDTQSQKIVFLPAFLQIPTKKFSRIDVMKRRQTIALP